MRLILLALSIALLQTMPARAETGSPASETEFPASETGAATSGTDQELPEVQADPSGEPDPSGSQALRSEEEIRRAEEESGITEEELEAMSDEELEAWLEEQIKAYENSEQEGLLTDPESLFSDPESFFSDSGDGFGGQELLLPGESGYTLTWDRLRGLYRYTAENGCSFDISVPLGGISEGPVAVYPGSGLTVLNIMYQGSLLYNYADTMTFTDAGSYCINCLGSGDGEKGEGQFQIAFRICPEISSDLTLITPPLGFSLRKASLDGSPIEDYGGSVFTDRDGNYELVYVHKKDPSLIWQFAVQIDRQKPVLTMTDRPVRGSYRIPASFTVSEEGCRVVLKDGVDSRELSEYRVTKTGHLTLEVTDPAGNVVSLTANFTDPRLRGSDILIILSVLLLLLLAALVIISRRKIQIL